VQASVNVRVYHTSFKFLEMFRKPHELMINSKIVGHIVTGWSKRVRVQYHGWRNAYVKWSIQVYSLIHVNTGSSFDVYPSVKSFFFYCTPADLSIHFDSFTYEHNYTLVLPAHRCYKSLSEFEENGYSLYPKATFYAIPA
jgi:hypothetical protein